MELLRCYKYTLAEFVNLLKAYSQEIKQECEWWVENQKIKLEGDTHVIERVKEALERTTDYGVQHLVRIVLDAVRNTSSSSAAAVAAGVAAAGVVGRRGVAK